jgi:cytochrome P450
VTDVSIESLPLFPFRNPAHNPFSILDDRDLQSIEGPISRVRLPTGGWAWLVTRLPDVKAALRSDAFSADVNRPGFPLARPYVPTARGWFIRMDGDEHLRLRRMFTAQFMTKNIRRIEPMLTEIVDGALDAVAAAGPPADLVALFALPIPSLTICRMLGVPYKDHAFFQECSGRIVGTGEEPEDMMAAVAELTDYLAALIETRRAEKPRGDDLLSQLITEQIDTGELEPEDLTGMAVLLLIGGHETTANMLSMSTLLLLQHPEKLEALRANPSLMENTVEELLRYTTIVREGLARQAVRDVEVGGQLIREGEGVMTMLSLANYDESAFADADTFDPYRQAHQHVAFGFGVHQCIGQPLARAEMRIALNRLFARFPTLRLAVPAADVPTRPDALAYGLTSLPVSW